MLYDPKWDKQTETKADPLQLGTMIAWLEKQPAGKTYCYVDSGGCLLQQYYTAHGFKHVTVGAFGRWHHGATRTHEIAMQSPPKFWQIASGHPRDFGSALERARAAHVLG